MSRASGSRNKQQRPKKYRLNFEQLGISQERYSELRDGCRAGRYSRETLSQACEGIEFIEPYILLSVTQNMSYDRLELYAWMERIPVGRTNFYWYRRLFYQNLNSILTKEQGRDSEEIQVYSG